MKLKKYSMAIYYLSKAVKFLEISNDKNIVHPSLAKSPKVNPNEHVNNTSSQKSYEIIFNYGLALFKSQKYYEAFRCFEKVSLGLLKQNPKLWYYMSLCCLKINRDLFKETNDAESTTYSSKLGFQTPSYERKRDS